MRETPYNEWILSHAFRAYRKFEAGGTPDKLHKMTKDTPLNRFRACLSECGWHFLNPHLKAEANDWGTFDFFDPLSKIRIDVKMRYVIGVYQPNIDYTVDLPVKRVKAHFDGRYQGCLVTAQKLIYPGWISSSELKSFPIRKAGSPGHGGKPLAEDSYSILRSQFHA